MTYEQIFVGQLKLSRAILHLSNRKQPEDRDILPAVVLLARCHSQLEDIFQRKRKGRSRGHLFLREMDHRPYMRAQGK